MFGSNTSFNHLEIGASDQMDIGTFGNLKWTVEGGTFFGNDLASIRFIEHKWFRSSDRLLFSNPLRSMQTLNLADTTLITHTARPYMQLYAIHHFNGAIMSKIPLINKLKLELVAGGGAMYLQENNFTHVEAYFGIERKIKIKRQLFKISTYYVLSGNNKTGLQVVKDPLFGFKIGLDFFNSWTNSWSY